MSGDHTHKSGKPHSHDGNDGHKAHDVHQPHGAGADHDDSLTYYQAMEIAVRELLIEPPAIAASFVS